MRILMLGNSFTYYNDLPAILSALLGEEVVSHTRGGAYLSEQLNPETELGAKTLKALREEKWDYVVLQEQSFAPAGHKEMFLDSAAKLCDLIHAAGAAPVMYSTWAYEEGTEKLASTGMSYYQLSNALRAGYREAAEMNGALVADVGAKFDEVRGIVRLYESDAYHPSAAGSVLAASVIARTIEADRAKK